MKARDYKKREDRERRQEEERQREIKKIKQFLEDYDDEKHDPKYYRGKELQKRLSERARELEADNKDRQREREEIEDLKLRMLSSNANITPSSGGTPSRLIDLYKKPLLDVTNSSGPPSATQLITGFKADPIKIPIASRLQALANSQAAKELHKSSKANSNKEKESSHKPEPVPEEVKPEAVVNQTQNNTIAPPTSFSGIQLNSFVPVKPTSNQSSPASLASPMPVSEASPSPTSKPNAGFQMTIGNTNNTTSSSTIRKEDEDSRQSFSSAPSPGMVSPGGKRTFYPILL